MPLIDTDMQQLLSQLNEHGPAMTKGNLARSFADEIAEAASRGWITTLINGEATRCWRLTAAGLAVLQLDYSR